MKHLILATAGHVDHGKTALIKALTGTDADRLPEEKARGITIELGFAHLALGDVSLGIVDVPGHEDFVKNMVAGVGSIDLALLVIAADDGWMPQTEEHLQILEYLGVAQVVVALTKIDLAPPRADLREQLVGTPFHDAPIVPVSTRTGEGLAELKTELARVCDLLPTPRDIGKPRLAVDRAFLMRGIGPVVTGTLSGGKFRCGDEITVRPSGGAGRIRALQTHNREVEESVPGMRTALSIPGLEIRRGEVITRADMGEASRTIDVLVRRSRRLPSMTRPLKHGATVRVHHGTASSAARIFFAKEEALKAGESALAQLRFDEPVFAFAGDRFILRDSSEQKTIAGGLVLEPDGNTKTFRSAAQQQMLAERAAAPDSVAAFVHSQLKRDCAVRRSTLLRQSHFSAEEISRALCGNEEIVCHPGWWKALREQAAAMIDREHKAQPNRLGLELPKLREAIAPSLPFPEVFDLLLGDLCTHGFRRNGEAMQRATHRPALPPALQAAGARIRAALAAKPFDPPSRKELASDSVAQQALRFLRETNELIEIGPDLVVAMDALQNMQRAVEDFLRARGPASVSDLRQALGSSRRVVVPLLEYFDRSGITRRVGDQRTLRT